MRKKPIGTLITNGAIALQKTVRELKAENEQLKIRIKYLTDDRNLEKKLRKDADDRVTDLEERQKKILKELKQEYSSWRLNWDDIAEIFEKYGVKIK